MQVAAAHREDLEVRALVAHRNWELLAAQAREFEPDCVVIADEAFYAPLREALEGTDVKVYAGAEAVKQVAAQRSVDVVVAAMVGFSGLEPTVAAIRAGKTVALANKETLVVAGELITRLAEEHRTAIVPVDSEHSAIFQCLVGEGTNRAEKLILTASGGPFRGRTREELRGVSAADALRHPNWRMGAKVTVDSASMMNKGFEVMEACWLFGMKPEEVEVVVHPQSVVHSMVQFEDGCVKAQLGVPDMRLPMPKADKSIYNIAYNIYEPKNKELAPYERNIQVNNYNTAYHSNLRKEQEEAPEKPSILDRVICKVMGFIQKI